MLQSTMARAMSCFSMLRVGCFMSLESGRTVGAAILVAIVPGSPERATALGAVPWLPPRQAPCLLHLLAQQSIGVMSRAS
jgi:hypothetical protein